MYGEVFLPKNVNCHMSRSTRLRLVLTIVVVGFTLALGVVSLFHTVAFPIFSAMLPPTGIVLRYYFPRAGKGNKQ
jgi:hypothetical protein